MFISKKRYNKEMCELQKRLNDTFHETEKEKLRKLKMQFETEKKEILELHNQEMEKLKIALSECQEALTLSQKRVKSEKHYYINNMLGEILKDLKEEKYKDDNLDLNFQYIKNEETDKYEVTTSFCQLCGVESEIHIFNTEIEAWLFCKVKTMNEDKMESTVHSECYTEYMKECI